MAFVILGVAFTWGLSAEPAAVGSDSSPISMKPVDWGSPTALFAAAPRLGGGVGGCLDMLAPSVTDSKATDSAVIMELIPAASDSSASDTSSKDTTVSWSNKSPSAMTSDWPSGAARCTPEG